jgi:calcyphosin
VNRDGTLSIDEFLRALRGDLSDTRKAIISLVF